MLRISLTENINMGIDSEENTFGRRVLRCAHRTDSHSILSCLWRVNIGVNRRPEQLLLTSNIATDEFTSELAESPVHCYTGHFVRCYQTPRGMTCVQREGQRWVVRLSYLLEAFWTIRKKMLWGFSTEKCSIRVQWCPFIPHHIFIMISCGQTGFMTFNVRGWIGMYRRWG